MGNVVSIALAIGVPLAGGIGIGIGMRDEVKTWYPTIKKPSWNPPNYLFGPVWTVLYTAMGVASWRVWRAGGGPLPLTLYAVQLAMNMAWSPLFFKVHNLKAATIDITALVGVLAATIIKFNEVDPLAAKLMLPYLGWTTFATALTWNIFLNNPDVSKKGRNGQGVAQQAERVASEATAKAANVFLAQGNERQSSSLADVNPPQAKTD